MAKYINPAVNDKNLEEIQANANEMRVCVGQPTDYADAVTKTRVNVPMGSGDYSIVAGTAGNASLGARKIVVAAKDNQAVSADGTVDHVALCDSVNTLLMFVTTTTPQALTNGSQVDIGQWENEIREPT